MLPPCKDSLNNKVLRANMISLILDRADQTHPALDLYPCKFGWRTDDKNMYVPLWNSGPVLPNKIGTPSEDAPEADSEDHEEEELIDDQEPEWTDDSSDEDI